MKKFWLLLICFTHFLMADTIGNVEYQLPHGMKNWKVTHKQESNDVKLTQYTHVQNQCEESFIVSFFKHPDVDNPPQLEYSTSYVKDFKKKFTKRLQTAYPHYQIKTKIISHTPHSIFHEWALYDGKQEISHNWERTFQTRKGRASLSYGYYKPNKACSAKSNTSKWIKTLKEAKITRS